MADKFWNIYKSIPVLGFATNAVANVIARVADDEEFVRQNPIDIANLNPLKNISDMGRHITGAFDNYDEGIWLGRRALGKSLLAFTTAAGIDVYHYAIMINGCVYHIQGSENGKSEKESFIIDTDCSDSLKRSFTWYTTDYTTDKSQDLLKRFSKKYQEDHYYKVLSLKDNARNCQEFVIQMLSYAAGISEKEAILKTNVYMGTMII